MPQSKKAVILGAGISGLYAAYLLKKQGFEVTILESRDRLGGRIHTQVIDSQEKLTVEMGAEWIGLNHHRLQKLCKELNLELFNHCLNTHLLYNHHYYPPSKWRFSKEWEEILHQTLKKIPNYSPEQLEQLEGIDLWHFLVTNHVPHRDIELLDLLEPLDYGESIRFIPALDAIKGSSDKDQKDATDYYAVKGGMSEIPKALAKKIGMQNIHLSQQVKTVHQSSNGVKVTATSGRIFEGDFIVCTIPGFSINLIKWDPELPPEKVKGYNELVYSRINKTHVLFDKRFWKDESFEMLTDQLPHAIYHATQNQKGTKGVLSSYTAGDKGHIFSNLTDMQKVDEILKVLSIPYKSIDAKILKVFSYYWGDDPFTGGAFALYEKYQDPLKFHKILQQPHNDIFFAGEHLSTEFQGFMEGSLESAETAVEQILKSSKD